MINPVGRFIHQFQSITQAFEATNITNIGSVVCRRSGRNNARDMLDALFDKARQMHAEVIRRRLYGHEPLLLPLLYISDCRAAKKG